MKIVFSAADDSAKKKISKSDIIFALVQYQHDIIFALLLFCSETSDEKQLAYLQSVFDAENTIFIHRGSYMSAHVLLNLLNELGEKIRCEACRVSYRFSPTSLINSIIQEHECKILFII